MIIVRRYIASDVYTPCIERVAVNLFWNVPQSPRTRARR